MKRLLTLFLIVPALAYAQFASFTRAPSSNPAISSFSGKVSVGQATAPTCSTNCGTSPTVTGSDTAGIVTMGATGVPASGWVVTFNSAWSAAPSCIVQMAKAGMVVGKQPLTAVSTTTTLTVVTNGTAPGNSDQYSYHCIGVS